MSVTIAGAAPLVVESPLWAKQQHYEDRAKTLGQHFTFYFEIRGIHVEIFVSVDLLDSDDDYFQAKYAAVARYERIFMDGERYYGRADIYSSPAESRKSLFADGRPTPLAVCHVLGYAVEAQDVEVSA